MRMEQYLINIDYGLWQVIMNGDEPVQTTKDENGVETEVPPKTAQALLQRQKERKAKSIMLLAIPDEYQLRFHTIKDAKSLWAAIKSKFGGNVESKKMQKTILKQQFENFSVSDIEGLDKAYDRFQKLISQLEVHGAAVSNEDANQKFLRALPSSWNNIALIMRNKEGIDELDIDDLYNNLKVFEADIKGSSGSSSNSQNVACLSAEDTNINSPQLYDKDLEQINHDDLEEMDLKWKVAMLSMRVKLFYKKTGRKLKILQWQRTYRDLLCNVLFGDNALIVQDGLGYDWSYIAQDEPTEFALMAYTSNSSGSDTKLVVHQKNEAVYEEKIAVLEFEVKDKRYGDQLNENDSSGSELFNSVFDSRSSDGDDNQTTDRFKKDNGYHVVPPPLTVNYMPPLADLSFTRLDDSVYRPTTNKTSASVSQVEKSTSQTSNTNVEMPRVESVRPSRVIIEDWVSDDDEDIFQSNDLQATEKPSFKRIEFTNARNESVKPKQAEKYRIITQNPKVDRRDWNGKMTQKLGLGFGFTKKACFVCGSYSHLIKDCDFHEKRMTKKSVLKNMEKNTGQREIRPFLGKIAVSAVKENGVTTVKASAGCVWRPKMTNLNNVSKDNSGSWVSKRVNYIDPQGRLKQHTREQRHLNDIKTLMEGFGCQFVEVLEVNVCKKNSIFSLKTECLVLSPDFKSYLMQPILLSVSQERNLVRGSFLSKNFENDHTMCFACQKDKKTTKPHVRFSWVFFLASKDETSGILKRFITEIENQLNHKVKVTRCDNGTEFKNMEINEFSILKGIKREFSVAKTPQQNRVAERKNRTLIEAARTMLADSLLPTVFWAEAVNTACYVLNRVLVTKPHNKTPYELIIGRPPSISFMRPFGCPITIRVLFVLSRILSTILNQSIYVGKYTVKDLILDKYVGEILKKFGFSNIRTVSTPIETNKALTKDEDGESKISHLNRSDLGHWSTYIPLYQILFTVCACQEIPSSTKSFPLECSKKDL
ncbi:ribonuclease H-like domain-containing protein [Tanacetum coccineum]